MARPRKPTNVLEILRLRLEGFSWPQIARSTGLGQGTAYRAYRNAIDALKPFQNPKAAAKLTVRTDDELPAGQDLA
jgi:hypothetical protein